MRVIVGTIREVETPGGKRRMLVLFEGVRRMIRPGPAYNHAAGVTQAIRTTGWRVVTLEATDSRRAVAEGSYSWSAEVEPIDAP